MWQEIIVSIILVVVAIVVVRYVVRKLRSGLPLSSCNCDNCSSTECSLKKNMHAQCKKVDKKIAHLNK